MNVRRYTSGLATAALLAALPALPAAEPPGVVSPTLPVTPQPVEALGIDGVEGNTADSAAIDLPLNRAFRVRLSGTSALPGVLRVVDAATGELRPAREMTLSFLSGGHKPAAWDGPSGTGSVVQTVAAGADGSFSVAGLKPGLYSVVGRGPEGYLAFGLHVLPAESAGDASSLDVIASPPADVAVIAGLAGRYMAAPGNGPPLGAAAATAPAAATPLRTVSAERLASYEEADDLQGTRAPTKRHVIEIGADGVAGGRVVALYDGTGLARPFGTARVFMLRNGAVAAQDVTGADGSYSLSGLTEGIYTLAVMSPIGVTVTAVEVETARDADVAGVSTGPFRRVAARRVVRQGCDNCTETAIIPPLDGGFTLFDVPVGRPLGGGGPFGGGGFGGGLGGGAAGGGLPGGLLPALLLGGGVAAAIALSSDDDDGDVEAASPTFPDTDGNGGNGGDGGNGNGGDGEEDDGGDDLDG